MIEYLFHTMMILTFLKVYCYAMKEVRIKYKEHANLKKKTTDINVSSKGLRFMIIFIFLFYEETGSMLKEK